MGEDEWLQKGADGVTGWPVGEEPAFRSSDVIGQLISWVCALCIHK